MKARLLAVVFQTGNGRLQASRVDRVAAEAVNLTSQFFFSIQQEQPSSLTPLLSQSVNPEGGDWARGAEPFFTNPLTKNCRCWTSCSMELDAREAGRFVQGVDTRTGASRPMFNWAH